MAEEQTIGASSPEQSGGMTGLTREHNAVHCGTTQGVENLRETERLQLEHLFGVLAGVALSVAKRRLAGKQVIDQCEP